MNLHFKPFLFLLLFTGLDSSGAPTPAAPESKTGPTGSSYEQRLYSPSTSSGQAPNSHLVAREIAADTIRRFRAAYPQLGSPRFLIYVNRDLVDQRSGLKLAGREETVVSNRREAAREIVPSESEAESTPASAITAINTTGVGSNGPTAGGGAELKVRAADGGDALVPRAAAAVSSSEKKLATVNRYERTEREDDSFEYRQLAREIEITFGRRLRSAGAALADQKVATALMADRPLRDFTTPTEGEQARKDREALARVADAVIEILIVHRDTTVARVSGNVTRSKPEIHVTAVRLNDSRILGQAASVDVLGSAARQSQILQNHTSHDITDAVALYLMDDMLLGLNQN